MKGTGNLPLWRGPWRDGTLDLEVSARRPLSSSIGNPRVDGFGFPSSRLIYARGKGAESCRDEESIRKEVSARLGYDPFFVWAERTIVTQTERQERGFRATVQLLDDKGMVRGSRVLKSNASECTELVKSVALAISIGVDPEYGNASADAPRGSASDAAVDEGAQGSAFSPSCATFRRRTAAEECSKALPARTCSSTDPVPTGLRTAGPRICRLRTAPK